MPRTFLVRAALAAALVIGGSAPAGAEPLSGTIVGAEAVNVRRGPGTESPAFVAVRRGTTVLVEERSGQWARIRLADGESGYINLAFVELAPDATVPVAGAVADPTPTGPLPDAPAMGAGSATPAIDRELAELRQRLASLEANLGQAGASPTPTATPLLTGDAGAPLPPLVEPPASLDVGPSLALAGVGLVVGFLFGTFYGQRQERNRRSRVRF